MIELALIRERYETLSPHLDERGRRISTATEAKTTGYGGIVVVSLATGDRGQYNLQAPPEDVRVHDFLIKELGRAVPYGIYDLAADAGWISVGMSADTAAFAVQTILR